MSTAVVMSSDKNEQRLMNMGPQVQRQARLWEVGAYKAGQGL